MNERIRLGGKMSYYVKLSLIVFLTVTLTACTTFTLPKGIPFSGDQEGNGIKQSGNKSEIETKFNHSK